MTNDENLGSAGRPAEKLPMVSREARDTAGGASALPASSYSRQRFLDFARNDKNLIGIR